MQSDVRQRILDRCGAKEVQELEVIQPLWNQYGTLWRVHLSGGMAPSVIVKHIQIPTQLMHPRGFASSISRERKIRSYQVETHWYSHQNRDLPEAVATPRCLDAFDQDGELFLLLEDLSTRGFDQVIYSVTWREICVVLRWLARFHAASLEDSGEGLWSCGTYWHLDTRPEELANIEGSRLHRYAGLLDARLKAGRYPTLVHGDAKLANFLFTEDRQRVAAVDFQYVGRGCAMKDVAYFVGSCLSGAECRAQERALLDVYFEALIPCLPKQVDPASLESEWRSLYPVAWADFQRFMMGWSPGHRKLTEYSDATTQAAIEGIEQELLAAARRACMAAGQYIQSQRGRPLKVSSKGFSSRASDVVTEIDLHAQEIILEILRPTLVRYGLGLLAEEGEHDQSRFEAHAFWAVDPLDGTQYYVDGEPGYATSIGLVSRSGRPLLGVVYDPAREDLYQVVTGQGVLRNGVRLEVPSSTTESSGCARWYADRSLQSHPDFEQFEASFEVRFCGGAVMNVLQLLSDPQGCYVKHPKPERGGCAIWDLAAVSLMVSEMSGQVLFFNGESLDLNRREGAFFNDVGLMVTGAHVSATAVMQRLARSGE